MASMTIPLDDTVYRPEFRTRMRYEIDKCLKMYPGLTCGNCRAWKGKGVEIKGPFPIFVLSKSYIIEVQIGFPNEYPDQGPFIFADQPNGVGFRQCAFLTTTGEFLLDDFDWTPEKELHQLLEWVREMTRRHPIFTPRVARENLTPVPDTYQIGVEHAGRVATEEHLGPIPVRGSKAATAGNFGVEKPKVIPPLAPVAVRHGRNPVVTVCVQESREDAARKLLEIAKLRVNDVVEKLKTHEERLARVRMYESFVWNVAEANDTTRAESKDLQAKLVLAPWEPPADTAGWVDFEASRRAWQETMKVAMGEYDSERVPLNEYLRVLRKHAKGYFDAFVFPSLCTEYVAQD